MSNTVIIQGTTYTINNIADARTALTAAQTGQEAINVLEIKNNEAR